MTLEKTAIEEATAKRLIEILRDLKGFGKEKEITPESNFDVDLEMDSVSIAEYCYFVEEEFGLTIPDERVWELNKVRHYVEYLKERRII